VILFDTSVLSRVFRRRSAGPREQRLANRVHDLLAGQEPLGIPGIVLQEVLSGVRSERQFRELQDGFLAGFAMVMARAADHVEAARLHNRCLAKGASVSGPDCLIAAMAISGDHELFTLDRDFETIARHAPLKLLSE